MSQEPNQPSRREILHGAGSLAAATILSNLKLPTVNMSNDETIRVVLVGCGGRGGGAAVNAVNAAGGNVKLVAMADVFKDRLDQTYNNFVGDGGIKDKMDVPEDRKFIGFDAYKKAMDLLKPGDVVILTTPPAFRWVHFTYAISKKLNVFMEKPVCVDGPSGRKMMKLYDDSVAAGLKVGVGLMSRHQIGMQELHKRIQDGEIGDIMLMRGYRMHGPAASFESVKRPDTMAETEYQIRRFHSFLWASGGAFNDFYIHHIDHLCWMKNEWPVEAQALGGRHYKKSKEGQDFIDQNFDTYSVEYTFKDGTKMFFDGRCVEGAAGIYSSYVHGTKGIAVCARNGDFGGPQATYKGQKVDTESQIWITKDKSNPYQNEWDVLIDAIRNNKPHNEVKRGVEATLVSSMGRMAAHTGQVTTFDQMLNSDHEFGPSVDTLNYAGPAPLQMGTNGEYPKPEPGIKTREY